MPHEEHLMKTICSRALLLVLSVKFLVSLFFLQYFPTLNCVHSLSSVMCKKLQYMLSYSYLRIKRLVMEDNKFVVARCFGFMCCVTAFLENV